MKRDSNIELLRIIAMLFILLHHLIVHAVYPDVMIGKNGANTEYFVYSILNGFFYVAVNLFVLISGYFGIRLRAKRIWSLYLQCGFYGLLTYLFGVMVGNVPFVPHTIITKSLLIFSHLSSWWFVVCYLILMVISPFLNYAIKQMEKKEYLWVLACFTFVQMYLGWFWQKEAYDTSGYSYLNFIYIYLIGGYMHRFVCENKPSSKRPIELWLYLGCALLFGICNIARIYFKIPFGSLWAYNNPIIVIGAVGLFLFVRSFDIQSNIINKLGEGVFAAYLITDIGYVGDLLYPAYGEFVHSIPSIILRIFITFITATVTLLVACIIDIIRARIMKPVIGAFDWIDNKILKKSE